jgi:DNA primase
MLVFVIDGMLAFAAAVNKATIKLHLHSQKLLRLEKSERR